MAGHNKMLKRRRQKSYGRKQLAKAAKAAKKLGKQKVAAKSPAA